MLLFDGVQWSEIVAVSTGQCHEHSCCLHRASCHLWQVAWRHNPAYAPCWGFSKLKQGFLSRYSTRYLRLDMGRIPGGSTGLLSWALYLPSLLSSALFLSLLEWAVPFALEWAWSWLFLCALHIRVPLKVGIPSLLTLFLRSPRESSLTRLKERRRLYSSFGRIEQTILKRGGFTRLGN